MMKEKDKAMYGISRIDNQNYRTHAWRVSLQRHGRRLVQNFPDKTYGSKAKALKMAMQHRDEVLRQHPPLTRKEFASVLRRHNKTGINGVCRYSKSYYLKDGTLRKNWFWEANWPTTPGNSERVKFSVKDFGEEGAKRLAIKARKRGMDEVKGIFWRSADGVKKEL